MCVSFIKTSEVSTTIPGICEVTDRKIGMKFASLIFSSRQTVVNWLQLDGTCCVQNDCMIVRIVLMFCVALLITMEFTVYIPRVLFFHVLSS